MRGPVRTMNSPLFSFPRGGITKLNLFPRPPTIFKSPLPNPTWLMTFTHKSLLHLAWKKMFHKVFSLWTLNSKPKADFLQYLLAIGRGGFGVFSRGVDFESLFEILSSFFFSSTKLIFLAIKTPIWPNILTKYSDRIFWPNILTKYSDQIFWAAGKVLKKHEISAGKVLSRRQSSEKRRFWVLFEKFDQKNSFYRRALAPQN